MPDLGILIGHWGYLAILVVVLLGNLGIPVPEEAILVLGGYMAWRRQLWLPAVLTVGILSAVAGDNFGYWIGRRCGRPTIERYGHVIFVTAERFNWMQRFVTRHGPLGIFLARFFPGFRFMAGPFAGTAGMSFFEFLVPNVLGAVVYVPMMAAFGYAVGYGFGDYVERARHVVGEIERIVVLAAIVCALLILGWRAFRASANPYQPPE